MPRWREYGYRFCLAVAFFSRLPIPASIPFSAERLNRASAFFSLVGTLIGVLVAMATLVFALWLPADIAVLLGMLFSLRLTGAFHEDGLADMADGLGGGLDAERKLIIMKDSRLGTYGAVTLFGGLLLKWALLSHIVLQGLPLLMLALIVMHSWSRAVAGSLIADTPYVRDTQSKSKPLAERQARKDTVLLLLSGLFIVLLGCSWPMAGLLILGSMVIRWSLRRYLLAQLGGFTGDCLGACQQLIELFGYLLLVALLHAGMVPEASWLEVWF